MWFGGSGDAGWTQVDYIGGEAGGNAAAQLYQHADVITRLFVYFDADGDGWVMHCAPCS